LLNLILELLHVATEPKLFEECEKRFSPCFDRHCGRPKSSSSLECPNANTTARSCCINHGKSGWCYGMKYTIYCAPVAVLHTRDLNCVFNIQESRSIMQSMLKPIQGNWDVLYSFAHCSRNRDLIFKNHINNMSSATIVRSKKASLLWHHITTSIKFYIEFQLLH